MSTCIHTHTHTNSHKHTHTHTHPHTPTPTHTHTHTHSLTHSFTHSLTHSLPHSLTHKHGADIVFTHTHKCTHVYTHKRSVSTKSDPTATHTSTRVHTRAHSHTHINAHSRLHTCIHPLRNVQCIPANMNEAPPILTVSPLRIGAREKSSQQLSYPKPCCLLLTRPLSCIDAAHATSHLGDVCGDIISQFLELWEPVAHAKACANSGMCHD
jgi:hypothetical protein